MTQLANVIDYGDRIVYDSISKYLISNLMVYFERHDKKLTDVILSQNNLELLYKECDIKKGAGFISANWKTHQLRSATLWDVRLQSADYPNHEEYADKPAYTIGDDRLYACDMTNTRNPWVIEVSITPLDPLPDEEKPNWVQGKKPARVYTSTEQESINKLKEALEELKNEQRTKK